MTYHNKEEGKIVASKLSPKDVLRSMKDKGYKVTDEGRFFSFTGRELRVALRSNHKYPQTVVNIRGRRYNVLVHRFAAYQYYGEALFDEGIVVRHMSDNVLDIREGNLKIGTYSDNERDKCSKDRSRVGSLANARRKDVRRLTMRKFTDDQIKEIKEKSSQGELGVDIAEEYGVTKDTIYQILRGETYKDVI